MKNYFSLISIFLFVAVIAITVLFSQQSQDLRQHAAATSTPLAVGISLGFSYGKSFGNMSSAQQVAVVNQMKNDGVQWIRLDYYPNDSLNYQFIKDAQAVGIQVDVLMEDFNATPGEFAAFGTQAVTTLKPLGVHTYEILNEVNTYSARSITPTVYVPMLRSAYTAIKAADPAATVLMSGMDMSGNPTGYLQGMYAAGAKGFFDGVNAHPYTWYPAMPNQSPCPSSNTFCYGLPALYAIMQQNGDGNKKIWITEFGCPTGTDANYPAACNDATLAQQIIAAYNEANSLRWAGPLFIFSWQDNTAEGDWGLYYANGSPKSAALAAFHQIAIGSASNATSTPTSVLTATPHSTNTPLLSATPTPLPSPIPTTNISLSLLLHGLGKGGDNANPTGSGNMNPQHPQRAVTLTLLNSANQPVSTTQGTVSYNQAAQNFQGNINISNIPSGQYLVKVQISGFLPKQFPGFSTITTRQSFTLPAVSLTTGDINTDSQLDIIDYNLLIGCFGSKATTSSCTSKTASDITDDGTVDGIDYNLFLRELSVQRGN